jgi:hypothetical protein
MQWNIEKHVKFEVQLLYEEDASDASQFKDIIHVS